MPASGFLYRTDDTWNRFPREFPALWILLQMCFHSYMLRLPGDKLDEYLLSFSPSFCMIANHAVRLSLLGDSLVFIMHVLSINNSTLSGRTPQPYQDSTKSTERQVFLPELLRIL